MHNPPHPGLVLREYLGKMTISSVAACLSTSPANLARVLHGKAPIPADMAQRLTETLGTSSALWLNMQSRYDLWRVNNGETIS